jgi:hypothetical protein
VRNDLKKFLKWLQGQRPEMEEMALARVYGVEDPTALNDPEYVVGLRMAVVAALDYGLAGVELGEEHAGPPPAVLLEQARYAARSNVDLDTILRRYVTGYGLLGDFIIQAIEKSGCDPSRIDQRRIWRVHSNLLDSLIASVAAEYKDEIRGRSRSAEERRTAPVKRLLAGHLLEPDVLQYEFDAWHIGAIARGPGAQAMLRDLAAKLDRQLLLASPSGGSVWAWLGGQRRITTKKVEDLAPTPWPPGLSLALGEPERSVAGWRLTHRQARAAMPIALRPTPRLVCYADVTLLAAALHHETLAISLQRLYLDPLAGGSDGGAALRQTLRAYFSVGRNASSAAAVLGVSRQTVSSRLRIIEKRLGRPVNTCAPEMDTALRLEELGY